MVIKGLLKFLTKKKATMKKSVRKNKPKRQKKKIVKTKTKKLREIVAKKEKLIAEAVHYFSKIKVVVLKLKGSLSISDQIHIKGHTTDFKQAVLSMQIDHKPVKIAKKGQEIGLKVNGKVRRGDKVFKL